MISIGRFQQMVAKLFDDNEKLALLSLLRQLFQADDEYRDIEQISFMAFEDMLVCDIPEDKQTMITSDAEAVEIFKDSGKEKQAILLGALTSAAVVDGDADIREAELVAGLAKQFHFSLQELNKAASAEAGYFVDHGLSSVYSKFLRFLRDCYSAPDAEGC